MALEFCRGKGAAEHGRCRAARVRDISESRRDGEAVSPSRLYSTHLQDTSFFDGHIWQRPMRSGEVERARASLGGPHLQENACHGRTGAATLVACCKRNSKISPYRGARARHRPPRAIARPITPNGHVASTGKAASRSDQMLGSPGPVRGACLARWVASAAPPGFFSIKQLGAFWGTANGRPCLLPTMSTSNFFLNRAAMTWRCAASSHRPVPACPRRRAPPG